MRGVSHGEWRSRRLGNRPMTCMNALSSEPRQGVSTTTSSSSDERDGEPQRQCRLQGGVEMTGQLTHRGLHRDPGPGQRGPDAPRSRSAPTPWSPRTSVPPRAGTHCDRQHGGQGVAHPTRTTRIGDSGQGGHQITGAFHPARTDRRGRWHRRVWSLVTVMLRHHGRHPS